MLLIAEAVPAIVLAGQSPGQWAADGGRRRVQIC